MKYPSLLDSKEGTSGMLLDSKETGICCSSKLKEVMMILVFFYFISVEVFENFMVCENFEDTFPFFILFVQMNSLFIEKGFWEAWGAKIIK